VTPSGIGADPEDQALVAAVRAGDDAAFERLYHRYQRRIGAYIYGMVHDHGRAEDITQDVFMSALRRMRKTDTPIAFKPWIYEIAKNACIDAFRRSRRAEEVSYDADDGTERLHLVSNGPTPDAAVDTRMSLDHLRGAFGGLSEAHHQILVMRELEGLSYRQIGEKLGMSRPSVESTLFRARRRLSEEYEELVSGERCRRIQGIIAEATDGRVGVRDERKMARHVSYCQPCRRAAFAAGFDPATLAPKRSVREKIAALLPIPAFAKRWIAGSAADRSSLYTAAAHYGDSTSSGWIKAAAAVAALAVAGMGADAVVPHGGHAATDGRAPAVAPAPAAATTTSAPRTTTTSVTTSGAGAISKRHKQRTHHGSSVSSSSSSSGKGSGASGSNASSQSGASGSSPSSSSSSSGKGASSDSSDPVKKATKPITDKLPSLPTGGGSGTSAPQVPDVKVPDVQVPNVQAPNVQVPTVPGAPPAVNGAVGAVDGAASGATGAVNGAASGATGGVNGVVHHTTDTVNNTTSTATGTVNKVTGGILGGG
jgi:RNA polymerase sigma factor (sigma-70 family)